jgi:hypothetical protein
MLISMEKKKLAMFELKDAMTEKAVACDEDLQEVIKTALKSVNNKFEAYMNDYKEGAIAFCKVEDFHGKAWIKIAKNDEVLQIINVEWPAHINNYSWHVEQETKSKIDKYRKATDDENLFITSALNNANKRAHCTHPDGRTCDTTFDDGSTARGEFIVTGKNVKGKNKKDTFFFIRVYDQFE